MFLKYSFFFILNEVILAFDKNQNLFQNIIENYELGKKQQTSYIISEEIGTIFPQKNNSFSIPIFISIIDLTHVNILNISNDRDSYMKSYKKMIGPSDRVFMNKNIYTSKNKFLKIFQNGTIIKINNNNNNNNEMIIEKIIIEKNNYDIDLYILKNRYMSQYQNINKDNQKLLKFYDLNVIFFKNYQNIYNELENNDEIVLKKIENDLIEQNVNMVISEILKNFTNNNIIKKLENKINKWLDIKNLLDDLMQMKHCRINLKNFLLHYQVNEVKKMVEDIEKKLVYLLYNEDNIELNFKILNESIFNLKNYLKQFDISKNDTRIDMFFYSITIIAIIIVIYLLYKTYKDFQLAFIKKNK